MSMSAAIGLAERGLLPLPGLRFGIRRLLARRLREASEGPDTVTFASELAASRLALSTQAANEQHYEVPSAFFELVLGPHLKYSSGYWPAGVVELESAELEMLKISCQRARLVDGQDVLELGCGWGSLTLYMAREYPNSRITAVSNSAEQRRFIESRAPANVKVITADMNDFEIDRKSDRVVSVEMFEHMRNYHELLRRIRGWLKPDGKLFVHVFCHREYAYPFETNGANNWMGRHFFTGGIMPSLDLFQQFDRHMSVEQRWVVEGGHYSRTARAWRENLESRRDRVLEIFRDTYASDAERWYHRWRLFFLSCEELFGYRGGNEWLVGHYFLKPECTE